MVLRIMLKNLEKKMKISRTRFLVERTVAYGLLITVSKLLQYTNVKSRIFDAQDNWMCIDGEGNLVYQYPKW